MTTATMRAHRIIRGDIIHVDQRNYQVLYDPELIELPARRYQKIRTVQLTVTDGGPVQTQAYGANTLLRVTRQDD